MISLRARIIRSLIKAGRGRGNYGASEIEKHRKRFERSSTLLFPSSTPLEYTEIAGVKVAWITHPGAEDRIILYLHGGGFCLGSIQTHRQHMARIAKLSKAKLLAIEYSLAPEHPYPSALSEIQNVWEELLNQGYEPSKIVIMGDSAGGGLAMGSALRFRDAKLAQPACLVLLSPGLDATFGGKSYSSPTIDDPMFTLKKLHFFADNYAQKHDKTIPYISPVYADLKNLPPILMHVGSEELLLSDSQTILQNAQRDNVDAKLYIGEGMWHDWHFFAAYMPEAQRAVEAVARYVIKHT